ncbi:MAG: 2-oxo acid dehydrogenase subunit E2, partial [bacterium]
TNRLRPDEYEGGTFTVSNLGMFDVENFIAIINPPHAAILAVGSAVPRAVVRNGQIVASNVMKLTLSADHRVTDGAEVARFLVEVKRLLENPLLLFIEAGELKS